MIDQATIQKIFDAADIYEVVSDFVSLKKRGVNYLGLCPFHNEKTGSFTVSPAKGIYKCFGCGKGGNAVNFIMEHEQMSYVEALKYLAEKYHIPVEEKRVIYLLKTKELTDTIIEILRNLFPHRAKTYLVPVSKDILSILHPVRSASSEDEVRKTAHIIVDTLNTEALAHVQIAYSGVIENLAELPGAFRESTLALKVGELFYSEQTVFPYNELGIGRLIYQLPVSLCESFLSEIFGEEVPDGFDEETTLAVNRFLQNNLNIAETARQLHMHRNTLIYRLEQIQKRTGLDLRCFEDAMTFKIATMVMNYLHSERKS